MFEPFNDRPRKDGRSPLCGLILSHWKSLFKIAVSFIVLPRVATMDRLTNRALHHHSPVAAEDVLSGSRLLRRAFLEAPQRTVDRDTIILSTEMRDPPVLLLKRGLAYTSTALANGRRAIVDTFMAGDIIGIEHAVAARTTFELTAADAVTYCLLKPAKLRELMTNQQIALSVVALMATQHRRREQHIVALTRLDARGRIATFLLEIYDRLRQHQLVMRPTFTLPLTQERIGDHLGLTMVHVSRTLRRLRAERLALVDRQVVIIRDLAGLRRVATGDVEQPDETSDASLIEAHRELLRDNGAPLSPE